MYIAFSLMILIVLRGTAILVSYVTEIFSTINPNISPYNASVMIIIIIIIGNIIFINLVDRAGRRTFFVCSSFGATFGLIIFAFYLYYLTDNHAYDWVPIVCVSCILFVSCLGMRSIPFIVVMEIFPKEVSICPQSIHSFSSKLISFFVFHSSINIFRSNSTGIRIVYYCCCLVNLCLPGCIHRLKFILVSLDGLYFSLR